MSLDCASPEQVKGLPVTTAADVYALGVLLYELLAGVSPQGGPGRTLDETIRRICDSPPERPSTWNRQISQDLDSIVLRAVQKDPQLRYASAEELSADIGRFLDGRPVIAREATFRYVARKFVARHRLAVAAAFLGGLVLMAGAGVVFWQSRVAARERTLAQRRFEETRKLARSVIFDMQAQLEMVPGTLAVRQKMIGQTVSYLESMARDAGDNTPLLLDLAGSYTRVGEIQRHIGSSNLGDTPGALRSFETALRLLDRVFVKHAADAEALTLAARIHGNIGGLYNYLGKHAEASIHLDQAVAAARRFREADPGSTASAELLGGALFGRATALEGESRVRAFEETLAIYESILLNNAASPNKMRNVALSCKYLAGALQQYQPQRALPYALRARDLDEARLAQAPGDRAVLLDLSNDLGTVGHLQWELGNAAGAVTILRRNLDLRQRLASEDPRDDTLRERLAQAHLALAWALLKAGDASPARTEFSSALSSYRTMLTAEPEALTTMKTVVETELGLAALNLLKRPKEACDMFAHVQPLLRRVNSGAGATQPPTEWWLEMQQGFRGCGLE